MGRDGEEEKDARKHRSRDAENDRMNLKSHLIFTLYTIYGILLKGEPCATGRGGGEGAADVPVCLCVRLLRVLVCVHALVVGQQQGRTTKGQTARSHTRVLSLSLSLRHTHTASYPRALCVCACMRKCVRALNVRAFVCKRACCVAAL